MPDPTLHSLQDLCQTWPNPVPRNNSIPSQEFKELYISGHVKREEKKKKKRTPLSGNFLPDMVLLPYINYST